jgi:hypothetical protein
MTELQNISTLLTDAVERINTYSNKPTKAESARIRKVLGQIKKQVTGARAALVEADKAA